MHRKLPNLPLIICADDDETIQGNPGVTKANSAALSTDANVAIPNFGVQRPEGITDFNDMAALRGLESVARTIRQATTPDQTNNDGWPDPLPLTARIDLEPSVPAYL